MAGGMLTKQAVQLSSKYLNDINDASVGGVIVSVPSGVPSPQIYSAQPGDRIVLDDATALALSDTTIGTLYGGVYMYVQFKTTTRAAVKGGIVFFAAADLGTSYIAYGDALPTTAVPTYIAGVLICVLTTTYYGWIQVAGVATVLFDAGMTAAAAGNWVSAKVSPGTASTADCGAAAGVVTLAAMLGVAVGLPVTSTASTVMLTRGNFCGRI
jgi:hypothetical protein